MSRPSLRASTMASSATRLAVAPAWMPMGWPMVPPPNCKHDVVAEQVEQLVHLPGVDAAGGDRHHFADAGPVLLEEQPARQIDLVMVLAQTL